MLNVTSSLTKRNSFHFFSLAFGCTEICCKIKLCLVLLFVPLFAAPISVRFVPVHSRSALACLTENRVYCDVSAEMQILELAGAETETVLSRREQTEADLL